MALLFSGCLFQVELLFYGFHQSQFQLFSGMPWQNGLSAIAVNLQVLAALFEGGPISCQPPHKFALLHAKTAFAIGPEI